MRQQERSTNLEVLVFVSYAQQSFEHQFLTVQDFTRQSQNIRASMRTTAEYYHQKAARSLLYTCGVHAIISCCCVFDPVWDSCSDTLINEDFFWRVISLNLYSSIVTASPLLSHPNTTTSVLSYTSKNTSNFFIVKFSALMMVL